MSLNLDYASVKAFISGFYSDIRKSLNLEFLTGGNVQSGAYFSHVSFEFPHKY